MAIKTNIDKEKKPRSGKYLLPSKALLYPEGTPSEVEVVPFGFETEDILIQPAKSGMEKLIKVVETSVVNFPTGFSFNQLLVGDLYAIIACARSLTYGENYRFRAVCPECDHPEVITVRVPEDVPIQSWDFENREELEKTFQVTLTNAKDTIKFKYLTVADEIKLMEFKKKSKAAGGVDSRTVHQMAAQIVSVNGGEPDDFSEAAEYVRKLRGQNMLELTEAMEKADCGIDLSWKMQCDKCQHGYEHQIPLSDDFFRRNRF